MENPQTLLKILRYDGSRESLERIYRECNLPEDYEEDVILTQANPSIGAYSAEKMPYETALARITPR